MGSSSESGALRNRLTETRLDVLAAVAGLLVAALLFPMRFLASQIYVETIPVVVGGACVLYLATTRTVSALGDDTETTASAPTEFGLPTLSANFARFAPGVVFAGVGVLAALAAQQGGRTPAFLVGSGIVGTVLLLEIAFVPEEDLDARIVFAQILALAFVVRFTALYLTPGLVGIDSWSHLYQYVDAILDQRSLAAIAEYKYYAAPLYHLLVAATVAVLDVSLRQGLFLSLGVLVPLSTLFVYATARFLVPVRWALFGAAFFAISDQFVRWSIHIIPTSMGLFFFAAIVYCVTRMFYTNSRRANLALLVAFSVASILTHQVSSFIMLVFVGAGVLAQLFVRLSAATDRDLLRARDAERVDLLGVLAFDLGFLVFMWSITPYGNTSFLRTILAWLWENLQSSAGFMNLAGPSTGGGGGGAAAAGATFLGQVANYLDAGGILLLMFVTVVGSLVALRQSEARQRAYTFVGAIVFMLFFSFGLPLFGIRTFLPGRWFAFLYVLMAVVGAVGLGYLARSLPREAAVAVVVIFALVFPTVMMTSINGTRDNPVIESERTRYAYDQSELAAVYSIAQIRPTPEEPLRTDHPYRTVFNRTNAHPSRMLQVNERGIPTGSADVAVYRRYQSYGGARFEMPSGYSPIKHLKPSQVCGPQTSRVYTNGDVRMCVSPDETGRSN